ncbi:hypothetical protein K469DRAFT_688059 [Zopfia rhizophila CBS 207.26]|uniref:Uncharacterized protein n=1 Tax=Zopfia rhizophila CBS 207.26 TaxID=1314779 RepID=A0A6A6DZY5_9PEZI|nr:hypothetical protein K469DRAFT_688059 [Zopfia rhizophila CBS 207.26]
MSTFLSRNPISKLLLRNSRLTNMDVQEPLFPRVSRPYHPLIKPDGIEVDGAARVWFSQVGRIFFGIKDSKEGIIDRVKVIEHGRALIIWKEKNQGQFRELTRLLSTLRDTVSNSAHGVSLIIYDLESRHSGSRVIEIFEPELNTAKLGEAEIPGYRRILRDEFPPDIVEEVFGM